MVGIRKLCFYENLPILLANKHLTSLLDAGESKCTPLRYVGSAIY